MDFVVETKGSLFAEDIREKENSKVKCGEAHFQALADAVIDARYVKATKIEDLIRWTRPHDDPRQIS
ncbi:MAG TPA: hypothetical protein VMX16_10340 [Terriglobia bacterium]|nr:hypothetical protein [Terriglobia bacterium]